MCVCVCPCVCLCVCACVSIGDPRQGTHGFLGVVKVIIDFSGLLVCFKGLFSSVVHMCHHNCLGY